MDHFDEWTKTLARSTSRRDALKTLAGGTVGGLLALLGVGIAVAEECKRNGKACKKGSQCCSGTCHNGTCVTLGRLYSCVCQDGEVQYCDPAGCQADVQRICPSACASRGGVIYIRCEPGQCVL